MCGNHGRLPCVVSTVTWMRRRCGTAAGTARTPGSPASAAASVSSLACNNTDEVRPLLSKCLFPFYDSTSTERGGVLEKLLILDIF